LWISDCGLRIEKENLKKRNSERGINIRLRHMKLANKKELPAISNSHEQNMALPTFWAGWGSGWRNSDHQARRDHRFPISFLPILRKERPAREWLRRKGRTKPSPLANLPGTGPTQWKNNRLRMMIRIPPARTPCAASLFQEFFQRWVFFKRGSSKQGKKKDCLNFNLC